VLHGISTCTSRPPGTVHANYDRDRNRPRSRRSHGPILLPLSPWLARKQSSPIPHENSCEKKHTLFADSILGFTVDTEGNPKDVCLIQPAGFGLDASAANAAKGYKFNPARDHGDPIAYPTTLQVSFRLYRGCRYRRLILQR